jgi:hypothetical protein
MDRAYLRWNQRLLARCLGLASAVAVLLAVGWSGWRLREAQARVGPMDRLEQLDAHVYRTEPTWVGHALACLPDSVQAKLPRALQADVLGPPKSLMATDVETQEVDDSIAALGELPSIEWIVVMERQLPRTDVDRIKAALPQIEVVEAAFVSGVIYTR